jgi:mono/diheme cytochrome c family protein
MPRVHRIARWFSDGEPRRLADVAQAPVRISAGPGHEPHLPPSWLRRTTMWSKPPLPYLFALVVAALAGGARAAEAQAPAQTGSDTAAVTDEVTDDGRKIFHGKGTCYACHGAKLQGGPVAPPLSGPPKWRNGDGSFDMILHVVRGGVPGTVMVSHPGGISEAQVIEVATYVYAVSHGLAKP